MDTVTILPADQLGKNFVPREFLLPGRDEYYYRNLQNPQPENRWRRLRAAEVERLVKNNNVAASWDEILVTDEFDPGQIFNNRFFGLVRIGAVRHVLLEHHDLQMAAGITNSVIIACDIGDDVAIHNVRYLAHYIIGDRCILTNIDEMHTTDHAKFGNGIVKEGEPEEVRIWLDVMNEVGVRSIVPFDGMIPADAYLWAKYRDDEELQRRLLEITQNRFDPHRGYYGQVGDQCVIKNSRILKDVKIGAHCYIKGANKLKNLTINSCPEEPTQIGEGVEMVNGIIGYGCCIFYGCKAVRFILGGNSHLKYGARLIHSFLGDNSTISCCEVLNNLIFPAHEQHHNNSFLIASVVMGQSNIAAGATLGSNHNSRANDNELQAGRGFWPGLCTSVKHPSRFASFVLLSKGDYPAELDIPLPFSLVSNNATANQLEVMPAYWWLYNMYALARNSWKYMNRDKRQHKIQKIEFEALAPDTAEEMIVARRLLEVWTAKAHLRANGKSGEFNDESLLVHLGRELFSGSAAEVENLRVLGEQMEKSGRDVVILKVYKAYHAYGDMLYYYAVKNLLSYLSSHPGESVAELVRTCNVPRSTRWVNLGGQLVPEAAVDQLRRDIGTDQLSDWDAIHQRYEEWWQTYPLEKQKHSYAVLCDLLGSEDISREQWLQALDRAAAIQQFIGDQVYLSRKKDFDNVFRHATFRNQAEMAAALGSVDDNSFVRQVRSETEAFKRTIKDVKQRLTA